jgi:hypothetical protein
MTVSNPVNIATAIGNGVTTVFPFTFLIPAGTGVVTLTTIATSLEGDALVEGVDYSITGEDDPAGGSITYPLSGSPLSADYKINIRRVVEIEQPLDLTTQSAYDPETLETVLDNIIFMISQVSEVADRAVVIGAGASATPEELIAIIVDAAADAATAAATATTAASNASAAETAAEAAQAAAEAVLSAAGLPAVPVALNYIRRNAGNTAYENRTPSEVLSDIEALPLAGGTLTGALTTNGQIVFPATANPSANANTLDEYEEGSFTPGLTFGGGSTGITYSNQAGRYIKIGRLLHVQVYIALTSKGSSTGAAKVTGLPFTEGAGINSTSFYGVYESMASLSGNLNGTIGAGATEMELRTSTATGFTDLTNTNFTNTSVLRLTALYRTTS